jgi:hypothetical protein
MALANPPGDQLRVLRPEVDDEDRARLRHIGTLTGRRRRLRPSRSFGAIA